METYRIERFGSVDGIALRSSEDPRPGPKEVLMRVRRWSSRAAAVGPARLGVILLSDGAGEVAAIGEGVTGSRLAIECRLLPPTLVRRADQARLLDRPARRQSRWDARRIRRVERGAVARAEPPLLRRSRDVAVCRGDRLGRSDRPSPSYRGGHGADHGSGGVSVLAL